MGTFIRRVRLWVSGFTLDTAFLSLLILDVVLAQVFVTLGAASASSLCFTFSFLLVALWFVSHLAGRWLSIAKGQSIARPEATFSLVLLALIVLFMAINFLVATDYSLWSLSFFRKALIILSVFLASHLCLFGKFEKGRLIQVSFFALAALSFWLGLSFFAGFARDYMSGALTLGYSNPNQTGLVLSTCIVLLLWFCFTLKFPLLKAVSVLAIVLDAYLNYATRCRAGWIAILLCFILYFLYRTLAVRRASLRFVSVLPLFIPIFVVGVYLALGTLTNLFDYLYKWPLFGKDVTTRLPVWSRALKLFLDSPVFGSYQTATLESVGGVSGFQNGFMDVLIEQGLIVFLLFIMYYSWYFLVLGERMGLNSSRVQAYLASAAGFLFFSCIFDSGAFLGILGWYMPMLLPAALLADARRIPVIPHTAVFLEGNVLARLGSRRRKGSYE